MITIRRLHADCQIPPDLPDADLVRGRLEHLVRDYLPQAIADRFSLDLGEPGVVYRVRQLDLGLWVDAGQMSDRQISDALANLLAQALVKALQYGPPAQVQRYESYDHFITAFLTDLFTGQAWERWQYREFEMLRGLSKGQVASQLLAPRPELLLGVTRLLEDLGRLDDLLDALDGQDLDLIWRRGLGFSASSGVPPRSVRERALAALEGGRLRPGGLLLREALGLYLHAVRRNPNLAGDPHLAAACEHLTLLSELIAARPTPELWQALAEGAVEDSAALEAVFAGADLPAEAGWALEWLRSVEGRAYFSSLARLAAPPLPALARAPARSKALGQEMRTQFAGLGLLLPFVRELELERLGSAGLYQLLVALCGRSLRALAWSDPAPLWLSGLPPKEAHDARLAEIAWPEMLDEIPGGEDYLGSGPEAGAARRVLNLFASRLRGFAESSPGYLAKQFIFQPGRLALLPGRLEVYLHRVPLGIVLHMAGMDGFQARLPWLSDRELWVNLPDGSG
jgi:hypothetical protein